MDGPVRFQCPPEFEAAPPSPCPAVLGGGSTELWLIRAPLDFCPESLEGCAVPLDGFERLRPPHDAAPRLYGIRGVPGGGGSPLLLTRDPPDGPLVCAPPLRGCLTITESFGEPPAGKKKKKKKRMMMETASPGGATAAEGNEGGPGPPLQDVGVTPPQETKRKKKEPELPEILTPGGAAAPDEGWGDPLDVGETPKKKKKKKKREEAE